MQQRQLNIAGGNLPSKTPVSVLQELLSRRGTTPKYELVQIEGAIHEPTFRYRVTVGEVIGKKNLPPFLRSNMFIVVYHYFAPLVLYLFCYNRLKFEIFSIYFYSNVYTKSLYAVFSKSLLFAFSAVGTGRSKKEAKHAAAKAILDKLVGHSDGTLPGDGISASIPDVTSQILSPFDDKIPGNPIGTLQEMCMSCRWPPPIYDLKSEKGLPHERLFTIECKVFKNSETGKRESTLFRVTRARVHWVVVLSTHTVLQRFISIWLPFVWIDFLLKVPFRNWQVKETSQKTSCAQDVAQAEGHAYWAAKCDCWARGWWWGQWQRTILPAYPKCFALLWTRLAPYECFLSTS